MAERAGLLDEQLQASPKAPRRQDSSFLSRYLYTYVSPLLTHGQKNDLDPDNFADIECVTLFM